MRYAETLRAQVAELETERNALLDELDTFTVDESGQDESRSQEAITARSAEITARAAEITARATAISAEISEKTASAANLDKIEEQRAAAPTAPNIIRKPDAPAPSDVRNLTPASARDAAMRSLEAAPEYIIEARARARVEQLVRTSNEDTDGDYIAKRLLLTENAAYQAAFARSISEINPVYSTEEARALNEFRQFEARAASSSSGSGGYGVPVLIDPTIILTSGAVDAPVLEVCRIETITTDTWKGVASAAAAWSTDAEAAAVSDDMTTLSQPTVSVYEQRAFIPFSIRIGMDYPNFAEEMGNLISQGYVDMLALKTVTGSGSDIQGIFTALDANTNVEVVVTSDGVFQAGDIDKVWKSLQKRFRRNAHWLMNVDVENDIRGFGSGTATSRFTVDQSAEGISRLNGRPLLIDDYCPEFTGATGASNILVVGDFKQYVFAQRAGMTVELVPHLFDVTTNTPTGQRGLFAWARSGGDSVNDNGFRLLQNQ